MSKLVLAAEGLIHRFGGLTAVKNVSLDCYFGEIHALIGPNGAGKSTLIDLLSGALAVNAGRILFEGSDISGLNICQRSRLGISRSYQRTNIFLMFTAFENCRLAAQSRLLHSMQFLRRPEKCSSVNDAAHAALATVGLSGRSNTVAEMLSHGEQRQLEIAMTLATAPRLLLLDEPLAGMGNEESVQMVELLRRLSCRVAILVVEHDVDAVFAMADVLTVMVNGEVLASGSPASIRSDTKVQSAYFSVSGALDG